MNTTCVLFGAGHMGAAMARGLLRSRSHSLRIIDPDPSRLAPFDAIGVPTATQCTSIEHDELLLLAMPPQAFDEFASTTRCVQGHEGLVISAMAGIRMGAITGQLATPHVVRAIPNTPAEVFEGMTVYCRTGTMSDEQHTNARAVLASFGHSVEVADESLIDAATALCGGGPAFVAYFANALQRFGEAEGLGGEAARRITMQLLRGTAELMQITGKPAMRICREVMTPGGTTERGIGKFDEAGLNDLVSRALHAACNRSRELGHAAAVAANPGERA